MKSAGSLHCRNFTSWPRDQDIRNCLLLPAILLHQPSLFRRPLPNCPVFQPGNNGHQEPGQKRYALINDLFCSAICTRRQCKLEKLLKKNRFFFQTNFFARVHMIRAFSAALILYYFMDASMSFKEARPKIFVCLFVRLSSRLKKKRNFHCELQFFELNVRSTRNKKTFSL